MSHYFLWVTKNMDTRGLCWTGCVEQAAEQSKEREREREREGLSWLETRGFNSRALCPGRALLLAGSRAKQREIILLSRAWLGSKIKYALVERAAADQREHPGFEPETSGMFNLFNSLQNNLSGREGQIFVLLSWLELSKIKTSGGVRERERERERDIYFTVCLRDSKTNM